MTAAVLTVAAVSAVRSARSAAVPRRKPVWLLDIDGVVNAASRRSPTHAWPAGDWRETRVDGFHILVAQPVIDFIDRVDADGLAELGVSGVPTLLISPDHMIGLSAENLREVEAFLLDRRRERGE